MELIPKSAFARPMLWSKMALRQSTTINLSRWCTYEIKILSPFSNYFVSRDGLENVPRGTSSSSSSITIIVTSSIIALYRRGLPSRCLSSGFGTLPETYCYLVVALRGEHCSRWLRSVPSARGGLCVMCFDLYICISVSTADFGVIGLTCW